MEVQEAFVAEGVKLLPVHSFCFPGAFAVAGKRFLCASIQAVVQSRERQLSGKQLRRLCASFRHNRTIYSSSLITSRGECMAIWRYPFSTLTALNSGIFLKFTMCLKFQLTMTLHSATVAKATCRASSYHFSLRIPSAIYACCNSSASGPMSSSWAVGRNS